VVEERFSHSQFSIQDLFDLSTRAEFLERFSDSANHNFKLKAAALYTFFDVAVLGIALELRRGPKVEFRK
jgi:hypothetical protein